jgi:hypothetical protein
LIWLLFFLETAEASVLDMTNSPLASLAVKFSRNYAFGINGSLIRDFATINSIQGSRQGGKPASLAGAFRARDSDL